MPPKAKPAKDTSTAIIGFDVDLVDTALRDSAFHRSKATAQVVSETKNNMVALPGQLFYSTQIPVCLWFSGKNEHTGKCRVVSELALAV